MKEKTNIETESENLFLLNIEHSKMDKFGIEKISNCLWCIKGEELYDGDQHTILIETEKPIEIIEKLFKNTYKKGSHDIIFLPEINLMFDHGYDFVRYFNINNRCFVHLYCRPLDIISIYENYEN